MKNAGPPGLILISQILPQVPDSAPFGQSPPRENYRDSLGETGRDLGLGARFGISILNDYIIYFIS